MRKTKKTFFDILKEIISHIVLIAVALIVLFPIIYVISAGFRTNQAIYGPLVDVNTWVDTSQPNRSMNKISKPILKNRIAMVFDGVTKNDIIKYEADKKNKKYEAKSSESKAVLEKAFILIDKNTRNLESKEYSDFIEAYENWKNSVSYDLAEQAQEQLFERYDGRGIDEHKFRYKYDIRTSLLNFKSFFTGTIPNADKGAKFPMFQWMLNSVFIAGTVAIVQLMVVALAAYVLSRFRFNGKKESLMVLLTIQVFPGTMAMVALYLLLQYLGGIAPAFGINTKLGLILIYLGGGIPFNIWMVKGYFDSIPKALEESATIDGATTWQSFTMIILPLVQPILAVATILSFVGQYNEFVLASIILNQKNFTLPVGLMSLMSGQGDSRFGVFSAASVLGSLPIVVLWLALQSRIISGLTGGAVKG